MKINRNFDNLVPNYLFADVARKTAEYAAANPDKKIIRLGIGDVTLPLAPVVVEAMKQGAEELAHKETFKGYPEYEGYDFLREAISGYYKSFGVSVSPDEIFVSDGAKSDCGNIGDIFRLSRLRRFEYHGGTKNHLHRLQRTKRFFRDARRERKGRHHLPLLS